MPRRGHQCFTYLSEDGPSNHSVCQRPFDITMFTLDLAAEAHSLNSGTMPTSPRSQKGNPRNASEDLEHRRRCSTCIHHVLADLGIHVVLVVIGRIGSMSMMLPRATLIARDITWETSGHTPRRPHPLHNMPAQGRKTSLF